MTDVKDSLATLLFSSKASSLVNDEAESDEDPRSDRIPFSENIRHDACKSPDFEDSIHRNGRRSLGLCNKENQMNTLKSSAHSKAKHNVDNYESRNVCSLSCLANVCEKQRLTPIKSAGEQDGPPLTPTANLKMLSDAVSPEIRSRERRRELLKGEQNDSDYSQQGSPESLLVDAGHLQDGDLGKTSTGSRKEKSLGLLCQKFLAKYPVYPEVYGGIQICLDEVAKELAVERRRIYDIVNVLESVEIVSRVAKNKYAWHGKTNLPNTLAKLKALAEQEGFTEQIDKVKEYEMNKELEEANRTATSFLESGLSSESSEADPAFSTNAPNSHPKFLDKSLGIMSQKFLMLFLVSKPKTVNLDLAAKILIGDPTVDKTENSKFKTKIRRLYDIANILTSLDLIRKVQVTEVRGRKPAFKYIGPNINSIDDLNICSTDGCHRPSSRHSLLDCVKNQKFAHIMNKSSRHSLIVPMLTDEQFGSASHRPFYNSALSRKPFSRHASFEQICKVAEKERSKLYSSSQPSSPVKDSGSFNWNSKANEPEKPLLHPKHIILVRKGHEVHKLHFIQNPTSPNITVPVRCHDVVPTEHPDPPPLSKEQVDAVLKSLKVPVPVRTPCSLVAPPAHCLHERHSSHDPASHCPSGLLEEGASGTTSHSIAKKICLDRDTNLQGAAPDSQGSDDSCQKLRPSPIRTLHFDMDLQSKDPALKAEPKRKLPVDADMIHPPDDCTKRDNKHSSLHVSDCNGNACLEKQLPCPPPLPGSKFTMHINNPPPAMIQLPIISVTSPTTPTYSTTNPQGMKVIHSLSDPQNHPHMNIMVPVTTTLLSDNQVSPTVLALSQPALALTPLHIFQAVNTTAVSISPMTLGPSPSVQAQFSSPGSVGISENMRFASPHSFFRNTPNTLLNTMGQSQTPVKNESSAICKTVLSQVEGTSVRETNGAARRLHLSDVDTT